MAATFTYLISQTDFVLSQDGLTNVINNLHWRCDAAETSGGKDYAAGSYGTQGLAAPDPSSFTAYDSVTEADCIAWLKAAMGDDAVAALEAGLQSSIDAQITPTEGTGTPWAA
ncbi:MAG: hypothetical protein CMI27_06265 [Opitutae bacterium]|nr:hypothetical protein [Opitutae bacterium]|tara:strand:+ start:4291 stop:4629 length:339 start_codon:yes stop_codon:yes gene_type:complete